MLKRLCNFLTIVTFSNFSVAETKVELPDTGVSGVYEVIVGTDDAKPLLTLFKHFGFKQVAKGQFSAKKSKQLYGVDSALTAYRLQNGKVDSHGLVRIIEWQKLNGNGVGYAQPETIGQRMMVMRTKDIFRLYDVFLDARTSGEKWLPTEPVYDDLYAMTEGKLNVINRRIGVREMAAYGELVNFVFYQRYGYVIPGYGRIGDHAQLQTSEITHNDFVLPGKTKSDLEKQTNYYRDVLGFKPEGPVVLDGDWQQGPKRVFNMTDGGSHWYLGFVSPNNIAGKLKFFVSPDNRPDRSYGQALGQKGITAHSVYSSDISTILKNAKHHKLDISDVIENEFNEQSFLINGPDGSSWQVIERAKLPEQVTTKLEFKKTGQ